MYQYTVVPFISTVTVQYLVLLVSFGHILNRRVLEVKHITIYKANSLTKKKCTGTKFYPNAYSNLPCASLTTPATMTTTRARDFATENKTWTRAPHTALKALIVAKVTETEVKYNYVHACLHGSS